MSRELKIKYIQKDRFGREVFLAPAGTIHKAKPVYLVDVEMDYEFHHGRKLCTIAFEKRCEQDPYYGEPDCPISPDWVVNVTNEDERRKANENPFRSTYMRLDRMRCDCHYHIGCARQHGCRPIEDTEAFIQEMKRLWNTLPANGKPEWLSMEDIDELGKKMNSDKIFFPNREGKLEEYVPPVHS